MYEDKTSENDELEANQSYDEDTTETTETTTEEELETEQANSSGSEAITLSRAELEERERDIRKEQDRRWKDRIKGLEGKEGSHESREESSKQSDSQEGVATKEEMNRFRLETKGIESKDQQDFVLRYAKLEGMSVAEALNDDVVKAKLEKLTAVAEKGRATQSPINRTGKPREKSPEELAKMAEDGKLPKTKEERSAALKALQSKYGRTNG